MQSESSDEEIGRIEDFLFDDHHWTVRYIIVKAGSWMVDRPAVTSPMAIARVDWDRSRIEVNLTRDELRKAPMPPVPGPMTRAFEQTYANYFGYPNYWVGPSIWGVSPTPTPVIGPAPGSEPTPVGLDENDHEIRVHGANEVSGYHIRALDGEIGHVEDFLIDSASWMIRYLVIDTSNWIGGRTILLAPEWVRRVDWSQQLVHVDMSRDAAKQSPQYDPTVELTREYEDELYRHYQKTGYWFQA